MCITNLKSVAYFSIFVFILLIHIISVRCSPVLVAYFSGTATGSQLPESAAARPRSQTPNEDGQVAELRGVQYVPWCYIHTYTHTSDTNHRGTDNSEDTPHVSYRLCSPRYLYLYLSHYDTCTVHAVFKSAGFWYITIAVGFNLAIWLSSYKQLSR
jgi:hypothetical protein